MKAVSKVILVERFTVTSRVECQPKQVRLQAFFFFFLSRKPQNCTVYSRHMFTCKWVCSVTVSSQEFLGCLFIPPISCWLYVSHSMLNKFSITWGQYWLHVSDILQSSEKWVYDIQNYSILPVILGNSSKSLY